MNQLTNEQLFEAYLQAKRFSLDAEFIELLKKELSRRRLKNKIIMFPDAAMKENLKVPFGGDQIS